MNTNEMIAVMQAYARVEAIEVSVKGADDWSDIKHPLWDWNSFEYRVKPKPIETLWYWEFKMSDGWHISQIMKDFLIKMYRACPSLDDCTIYALFVVGCSLINISGAFFLAMAYVCEGFIFWRVIHVLTLLNIIQLAVIATVAYLKDEK